MHYLVGLLAFAALLIPHAVAQVKITPGEEKIAVEINGKPFTGFFIRGADLTKPYLHPLRAADGTTVSRMFPMEVAAGDPTDHPHQRSLWVAHAKVNNLDFWNNEATYKTPNRGKITLAKLGAIKSGEKQGSITASFDWTGLAGDKLLVEDRTMTFYADPKLRIIDFDITLTAVKDATFHDEKDGFFGIRMRPDLQEKDHGGKIENAQGLVGEKQLWGKPSEWCDYSGKVNGETLGIAILDHPGNPSHPVRWHARGYGLFAANPFGKAQFTGEKPVTAGMTLKAGEKMRFRYRVVIHPGEAKDAGIAGIYQKYAAMK